MNKKAGILLSILIFSFILFWSYNYYQNNSNKVQKNGRKEKGEWANKKNLPIHSLKLLDSPKNVQGFKWKKDNQNKTNYESYHFVQQPHIVKLTLSNGRMLKYYSSYSSYVHRNDHITSVKVTPTRVVEKYSNVVEGLKNELDKMNGSFSEERDKENFKELVKKAKKHPKKESSAFGDTLLKVDIMDENGNKIAIASMEIKPYIGNDKWFLSITILATDKDSFRAMGFEPSKVKEMTDR